MELTAYEQDSDAVADDSDWSISFSGGVHKPAPVHQLDGRVATMATPARSMAELRARYQPVDMPEWPLMSGHVATHGRQQAVATPHPATDGDHSRSARSFVAPVLDSAANLLGKIVDHARSSAPGSSAAKPGRATSTAVHNAARVQRTVTASAGESVPAASVTKSFAALLERLAQGIAGAGSTAAPGSATAPAPSAAKSEPPTYESTDLWTRQQQAGSNGTVKAPAAEQVDQMMGGMVDLVSGIIGRVAGTQAGAHTHAALTELTGQVSQALAVSNTLNNHHGGAGTGSSDLQLAMPERTPQHISHTGSGLAPESDEQPIVCLALGCTEQDPSLIGHHPGVGGRRGPPTAQRPRFPHDSPSENDPASWSSHHSSRTGSTIDNFITGILGFVQNLIGSLPQGGGAQDQQGQQTSQQQNLSQAIGQLTNSFVSELLQLLGAGGNQGGSRDPGPFSDDMDYWEGLYYDAFMAEAKAAGQQQQAQQPMSVDEALGNFTDTASGLVSQVAGDDAGQQTGQALNGMFEQLLGSGSGGTGNGGGANHTAQTNRNGRNVRRAGSADELDGLDEVLSRFVDGASGVVSKIAGGQAGRRTEQALDELREQLTDNLRGRRPVQAGHNSVGKTRGGQDRHGSIGDSISGFLSDLFDQLGLGGGQGRGQSSSLSQQQGSGRGGLAEQITELTNDFVTDLLKTLGASAGGNNGSGNNGGSGGSGSGTRPATLADFAQILGGVTDVVSGLVGQVAGQRAGDQARQLLTAAAQDVLAALAASGRYGQGSDAGQAGQNGSQDGQDNSWALNNGGQFAGTNCEGDVECALANDNLQTRQPNSLSNRGPPQLLNDPDQLNWWDTEQTTAQALNDRLAVINGQKSLAAAKTQLGQKKITQADYDKRVAAQKALQTTADRFAAQLDPYSSQLLDDVVTGQQGLTTAKAKLAAAKTQLGQGKITQAAYDKQSAAYNDQRDTVYAQTAELRAAAGYDRSLRANPGHDGAGAACANTGAFAQCSAAATDPTTGQVKRDQSLCLVGISGCDTTVTAGDRTVHAACNPTDGCATVAKAGAITAQTTCGIGECNTDSSADSTGADTFCQARAACSQNAKMPSGRSPGISRASGTCSGDCALHGFAGATEAGSDCQSRHGVCDTTSTGSRAGDNTEEKQNGAASSVAHCRVSTVGCDTSTMVRVAVDEAIGRYDWFAVRPDVPTPSPAAEAKANCADGATGCRGNAKTTVNGRTEHTRTTPAQPAVAAAGGVPARPASPAKTTTDVQANTGGAECKINGGDCAASAGGDQGALAASDLTCKQSKGCGGAANTGTKATVTAGGTKATRATSATNRCTANATDGECAIDASSETTAGDDPTANSALDTVLHCTSADCTGSSRGATSGAATGDVTGGRDSADVTRCAAHGPGADCGSVGSTEVGYRENGPVSVSHADSQIRCTNDGDTKCGGNSYAETSALDTAVSAHRRGASTTGDCTVTHGGCLGQASSDASTMADYLQTDPKTGKPVGPTTGPSATSRGSASLDCRSTDCEGTAHTTSASWDGAVDGGKPRTSEGSVGCVKGAATCQVQTLSTAFTGPGATLAYSGDGANAARLGTGPSAASTTGGKLTCQTDCGGKVTLTVLATNSGVSAAPRGNRAEGSCTGATGGTCTAVVNGAASSGPDANSIKPMVTDQPTSNATVTNEPVGAAPRNATDQPKQAPAGQGGQQPNQPATAPGSTASTGGPTVPGASSWASAWAQLNCAANTGCKGRPVSSATGLTGDNRQGGEGTRGPPGAAATGATTGGCDTTGPNSSACQATATSTAASGQVVADVFTEQNGEIATQAQQAAEKAKQTTATAAQRKAAEQAAKTAAESRKAADAATRVAKKPVTNAPDAWSESATVTQCAGPGCVASATGTTSGLPGASTSDAKCTAGEHGCMVTAAASTALVAGKQPTAEGQTSASVICPEGGCPDASSRTKVTATGKVTAGSSATCAAGQPCQGETTGVTGKDTAQAGATCVGTGCRIRTDGHAEIDIPGSRSWSVSHGECIGGKDGRCAGQSTVAVSREAGAQSSAACAASPGSKCGDTFATASSRAKNSTADADADGSSTRKGGEAITVTAQAFAVPHQATAGAGCIGSPNCAYHARAKTTDHLDVKATYDTPGGYFDAVGQAECRGGAKNGTGCGVNAIAVAGSRGSGECTGQYATCDHRGGNHFTKTAPSGAEIEAMRAKQVALRAAKDKASVPADIRAREAANRKKVAKVARDLLLVDDAAKNENRDVWAKMRDRAQKELTETEAEAKQIAKDKAAALGQNKKQGERAAQGGAADFMDEVTKNLDPKGDLVRGYVIENPNKNQSLKDLNAAIKHARDYKQVMTVDAPNAATDVGQLQALPGNRKEADAKVAAANANVQKGADRARDIAYQNALRHGMTKAQSDLAGRSGAVDFYDAVAGNVDKKQVPGPTEEGTCQGADRVLDCPKKGPPVPTDSYQDVPRPDFIPNDPKNLPALAEVNTSIDNQRELDRLEQRIPGLKTDVIDNTRLYFPPYQRSKQEQDTALQNARNELAGPLKEMADFGERDARRRGLTNPDDIKAAGTNAQEKYLDDFAAQVTADDNIPGFLLDRITSDPLTPDFDKKYKPALDAARDGLTSDEAAKYGPALKQLKQHQLEAADDPLSRLAKHLWLQPQLSDKAKQQAVSDPAVVEELLHVDLKGKAPTPKQLEDAANALTKRQTDNLEAEQDLAGIQSYIDDLNDRMTEHNAAVNEFKQHGGSAAEAAELRAEGDELKIDKSRLDTSLTSAQDLAHQTGQSLRNLDVVIVDASGNHRLAGQLRNQVKDLDMLRDAVKKLPKDPKTDDQKSVSAVTSQLYDLAGLRYGSVRDTARGDDRFPGLSYVMLPSTDRPDVAGLQQYTAHVPGWDEARRDPQVKEMLDSMGKSDLDNLIMSTPADRWLNQSFGPNTLKADQRAALPGDLREAVDDIDPEHKGTVDRLPMWCARCDGETDGFIDIYRVRTEDGQTHYVDLSGGTYDDFQDYLDNNELDPNGKLIVTNELANGGDPSKLTTVDAHNTSTIEWIGDKIVAPAMLLGGIALTATGAGSTLGVAMIGGSLAYGASRVILQGVTRVMHNQSINPFTNSTARGLWLSLGANVLGALSGGLASRALSEMLVAPSVAPIVGRTMAETRVLVSARNAEILAARGQPAVILQGAAIGAGAVSIAEQLAKLPQLPSERRTEAISELGADLVLNAAPIAFSHLAPTVHLQPMQPGRQAAGCDNSCVIRAKTLARQTDPTKPVTIPAPSTRERDTDSAQEDIENEFDGHTELTDAAGLNQRTAGAKPGDKFFVWTRNRIGHVIFARRTATGMEYLDGDQVLDTAPDSTVAVTVAGSGRRTDPGLKLSDHLGAEVGTREQGRFTYVRSLDWWAIMPEAEKLRYLAENEGRGPELSPGRRRVSEVLDEAGNRFVVYSGGEEEALVRAVHGARFYRVAGIPVVDAWLSRNTEPIVDPETGETIVEAGQTVHISKYLENSRPLESGEYTSGPLREQIRKRFGLAFMLNDEDGMDDNLRRTEDGIAVQVDMDKILTSAADDPESTFAQLRNVPVFRGLTDDEIADQFADALRMRDELTETIPEGHLRDRLTRRMDWAAEWVGRHNDPPAPDDGWPVEDGGYELVDGDALALDAGDLYGGDLPLGPDRRCACEADARAESAHPEAVNPDEVPVPFASEQVTDAVQPYFEGKYNAHTELTGPGDLDRRMAGTLVGTRVFAWLANPDGTGHVILGVRRSGGTEYYDGHDVLTRAPENTVAITVHDSGMAAGPRLSEHIGEYVGAGEPSPRTPLDAWHTPRLREIATLPPDQAQRAALYFQSMNGLPTPVDAQTAAMLRAHGYLPLYRGIRGEDAAANAHDFLTGDAPFIGYARDFRGTGHNFSTDGGMTESLYVRGKGGRGRDGALIRAFLRPDAVVLDDLTAGTLQGRDIATARANGEPALARAMEDLGVWAAIRGVDAIRPSGYGADHVLVINRGALVVAADAAPGGFLSRFRGRR
ncbi:DUF4781 domain-containing protein [Pseudonocardia eucalypti]|uniref:DUF4781 domain-containing protein n=1 Tax=Pseudonocardia eucalypti TaxID=648755 RepID=UPI0031EAB24E